MEESMMAILTIFDKDHVIGMKKDLRERLEKMCEAEKTYCAQHHTTPTMNPKYMNEILKYLELCANAYHVKVLEKMLIEDMEMPNSFKEIEDKAAVIMTKVLT